jgi:hypothetical protein
VKVLVCHNFYQQLGGEGKSVSDEVALLLDQGHNVTEYFRHNDEIKAYGPVRKALLYFTTTCRLSPRPLIMRVKTKVFQ